MKAPRTSASAPHDEHADAYTVEQFAARHAISRSHAYKQIKAGRLTARKVDGKTIITIEDAAKWRRALPKVTVNGASDGTRNGLPAWLSDPKLEHLRPRRSRRRTQPKTQDKIEPEGETTKQKPPR